MITDINGLVQHITETMGLDDEMIEPARLSIISRTIPKRFEDITTADMARLRARTWKDLVSKGLASGPWQE